MKKSIASAVLAVFAALAGLGGVARADKDKERADVLFKQGKKLMADKRYADACPAFEQSYKLDPGIGGELNIAKCYEEWGKLGRALRAYQAAEQQAKDAHDARVAKIHELIEELDSQVPRLTIRVAGKADAHGLTITMDGTPLDLRTLGEPQIVDPGPHTIEYTAPGRPKKTKVVPVERGGTSEISLDLPLKTKENVEDHSTPERKRKPEPKPEPDEGRPNSRTGGEDPGRTQKIIGISVGGAGVVAMGISSAMTLSARSKYKDALANDCSGMTNMCDPVGLQATHDARHEANIATVVFMLGLGAVGGGVALYLLAPHASTPSSSDEHALYIVPSVSPDGGGVVFGGKL